MNEDNIDNADSSKRSERTTKTRRLFIEAGQRLFAQRGVDAVSVNEITGAAGQKNRVSIPEAGRHRADIARWSSAPSHVPGESVAPNLAARLF